MRRVTAFFLSLALALPLASSAEETSAIVRYRALPVVTYTAYLADGWLVVTADHAQDWHTYSMDNLRRAQEATGKERPDTELPTRIDVVSGIVTEGAWQQTPPEELSDPAMHWYTWGFNDRAIFTIRAQPVEGETPVIRINGQSCNASSCSMVRDVDFAVQVVETLPVDLAEATAALVEVRRVGDSAE